VVSDATAPLGPTAHVDHLDARLIRHGAVGGLVGVVPTLNPEIVQYTPRVQFFVGHLLFGATVGALVSWRSAPRHHAALAQSQ
jgi:hypothetical protein